MYIVQAAEIRQKYVNKNSPKMLLIFLIHKYSNYDCLYCLSKRLGTNHIVIYYIK